MIVGLMTLNMRLPGCKSLKEKRHRLKGVIERVRGKFNVSATEIEGHDGYQWSLVAVSMVHSDKLKVEQVFSRIEELFAEGNGLILDECAIDWY